MFSLEEHLVKQNYHNSSKNFKRQSTLPKAEQRRRYHQKRKKQVYTDRLVFRPRKDIQRDPTILQKILSPRRLKFLNIYMNVTRRHKEAYFSQKWLARRTGYSLNQTHRLVKFFEQLGIIGTVWCGYEETCLYYSSPFFDQPWVQHALRNILRVFYTLAIGALFSLFPHNNRYEPGVPAYTHGFINNNCHGPQSVSGRRHSVVGQRHGFINRDCQGAQSVYEGSHPVARCDTGSQNKQKMESGTMERIVEKMQPAVQYFWENRNDLRRGMPLTAKGMIKLNAFPVEVHRKAYMQYIQRPEGVVDIFNWYFKRCLEAADELGVSVDWQEMYQKLEAIGCDTSEGGEIDTAALERLQRPVPAKDPARKFKASHATEFSTQNQKEKSRMTEDEQREYYRQLSNQKAKEHKQKQREKEQGKKQLTREEMEERLKHMSAKQASWYRLAMGITSDHGKTG